MLGVHFQHTLFGNVRLNGLNVQMTYSKLMLKIKTNPQTHSQGILEGAHI